MSIESAQLLLSCDEPGGQSSNEQMELPVYNLEFRSRSFRFAVDGFMFERVPNYAERHSQLQCLVNCHGPEFIETIQTGGHAHTANVIVPDNASAAVIPWQHNNPTALDDIILLLRLFTGRDVFALPVASQAEDRTFAILADPRVFTWGGVLICSIPYESKTEGDIIDTVDASLEIHLPAIYGRIKDQEWQQQYKGGYFLVLLSQAVQQRTLEAAFIQCWTIWEHLFACLNDPWMSRATFHQLSSKEKISFLLVHFEIRIYLKEHEKSRLDDLVAIRNRLIHFGQFPQRDAVHADAELFVRMTEYIAAKALGLYPSNVFNTIARFEEFLVSRAKRQS